MMLWILVLATCTFVGGAGKGAVAAEAPLALNLDARGRLTAVKTGGLNLSAGVEPVAWVSLCDVTRSRTFVAGAPTGGRLFGNGLRVAFAGARADVVLTASHRGSTIHVETELRGKKDLPARGVLLRFAFPLDCVGWQWHDDLQTRRVIAQDGRYENVRPLRAWADLPEWKDQPDLRLGYSNRNFCTVLTGPMGLCLSVPLGRPCFFRTAYEAAARRLLLTYDLALSPDTRTPNTARFAFDLYPCDAHWGFRSALARYYRLYPQRFDNRISRPGQWMAFTRLSEIDNANEFLFGLQEGASEPEYDDRIGVLSTLYFVHAGMYASLPNYDPEKDPLPPYPEQVRAMEAQFKRVTGKTDLFHQAGLFTPTGKLDIRKARVYGHLLAQFNLDPDLPYGAWHLDRTTKVTKSILARRGGHLDGFYYDGLPSGLNYRTEHFKYAAAPPLWDPTVEKPALYNFFSACEFARAAAQRLRPRGQITMMNGALGASFFVAPWLDVFGAETGLRINREQFNYIRSVAYHKPFLTLLKGNYERNIGHAEMELFMKRALAYGVFPGFFDWPPSGLGPGGRYWDHPEYYERDRDLFRRYLPLCRTLAAAGWEPVTFARSSDPHVFVERFGPGRDGLVYLTLLNEDTHSRSATVTLDLRGLGLSGKQTRCWELLTLRRLPLGPTRGVPSVRLSVPAQGVALLQLGTRAESVASRLTWAVATLDRGTTMRRVDAGKPAVAVHWRPRGGYYHRERTPTRSALVFAGADGPRRCTQWAMLFQPAPAPVTLVVRAAAENLTGPGKARIVCNAAWVTSSFTHYRKHTFDLPGGTYPEKEFRFTVRCDHPLRALAVTPQLTEATPGRVKFISLRLEDRFGNDYVVDPEFTRWYEPLSPALRQRVDHDVGALRDILVRAADTLKQGGGPAALRRPLLTAVSRCQTTRRWIAEAHVENGCRRVLRDLETVDRHLTTALLAALDVAPPALHGPTAVAPGDEATLTITAPRLAGLPVQTTLSAQGADVHRSNHTLVVTVPRSAAPGAKIPVTASVALGRPPAQTALSVVHTLTVVPGLEVDPGYKGADPDTGAVHLHVRVRNNRHRTRTVTVAVTPPPDWPLPAPVSVAARTADWTAADLTVAPRTTRQAGMLTFVVTARADGDVARRSLQVMSFPKEANLLRNPGFEQGGRGWTGIRKNVTLDHSLVHSGKTAVRLENKGPRQSTVSQSVMLNQQRPCPVLVQAVSRGRHVSGPRNRGYSLYVDIYYTDGTPLYGQTYDFLPGTTDWQLGQLYLEPTKPIRTVNVYLLLRGKAGTVWFDDLGLMEDPRRKGNVAREAAVTVDSSFSGYRPGPLTDGIAYPPDDAHWTAKAWASAETPTPHFVTLTFRKPQRIGRVALYWSLDAGIPRTSTEVRFQARTPSGWHTVATVQPAAPTFLTTFSLPRSVSAAAFRLYQPPGRGPVGRRNLLWLREVELFPAERIP